MRISDWSSDVCSSDLGLPRMLAGIEPDLQRAVADRQQVDVAAVQRVAQRFQRHAVALRDAGDEIMVPLQRIGREISDPQCIDRGGMGDGENAVGKIGRASGRESVWQYVEILAVD